MNENTNDYGDTQLTIFESDASLGQGESLSSFPQGQEPESFIDLDSNKEDPPNPRKRTLEKEYEKILIQEEAEGVEGKEFLLNSSDNVILKDIVKEKKKIINKCLNSTFKWFFTNYCEVSMVACTLRERWVFLFSVLICSKAALEVKNPQILVPRLFLILYCCLVYQMIENMYKYRFLRTTTNLRNEKTECLFDFADKVLITFFLSILNLHYYKLINEWLLIFPPILFLLETLMYQKHCLITQAQDDMKIVVRIFYVLQSLMIALKITHILDLQWRTTLSFLLVYLAINGVYAIITSLLMIALCLTFFINFNFQIFRVLRNRLLGYIWHIGFSLVNVASLIALLGFFDKISSKENETLDWGLGVAKSLSSFLMIFSALLFPILKKHDFNPFHDVRTALQNQMIPKKYTVRKTEEREREAFFLMISPTYFSKLRDMTQEKFDEMTQKTILKNPLQNKEEEDLCYVCENHVSNAILGECGHGGVCCECALKLIDQKNECMGCRKPVTAIYKIEDSDPTEGIAKAKETVEIIENEDFDVER